MNSKLTPEQRAKFEREEADGRAVALNYLRGKFLDVDEKVFRTDSSGYVHDEIIAWPAVFKAAVIENDCRSCKGRTCKISQSRADDSRPVIKIAESPKGYKFLDVRWTFGFGCRFQPLSGEFGIMFRKSGLKNPHVNMTFKAYECSKSTPETRTAKLEAMNASAEQSDLVIAGKPGTGKTHLAVAIALKAMEHGRQATFRLVSTMLDEIQSTIRDGGDYDGLMRSFMTVPCLILDDLGHENMTAARASYLHQIVDYRHNANLQTIVTTNARNVEDLCRLVGSDFAMPIVSRLMKRGSWVTINNAEDFRTTKREVNSNAK